MDMVNNNQIEFRKEINKKAIRKNNQNNLSLKWEISIYYINYHLIRKTLVIKNTETKIHFSINKNYSLKDRKHS